MNKKPVIKFQDTATKENIIVEKVNRFSVTSLHESIKNKDGVIEFISKNGARLFVKTNYEVIDLSTDRGMNTSWCFGKTSLREAINFLLDIEEKMTRISQQ